MIDASELNQIIFGCGNFGGLGSSPALRDKGDGEGAALALLDEVRYVELSDRADFNDAFVEQLAFPGR